MNIQCASWGDYIKQNLACSFPLLLLVKIQFPPSKSNYHAGLFSVSNKTFTKIPEQKKVTFIIYFRSPGKKRDTKDFVFANTIDNKTDQRDRLLLELSDGCFSL